MPRAPLALSVLALGVACGRPPSTTPLGGTEWVPPEPRADRRAPSSEASERSAAAPVAAPPPAPSSSTSSSNTPTPALATAPGELRFGFEPLTRGATIVVDTRYAVHAQFSTRFQGLSTDQKIEASAHEKIEIRVTEMSGDELRELELSYVESESVFSLSDTPNDVDSNKGKRYRVSFDRGNARVRALSGSASTEDEKGVLFDLATVTGFVPLVRPHLPSTLSPGWKARLDAKQVSTVFGDISSLKLEGAWLTLRGRDASSADAALFDCGLPVRLERDGLAFSVELKGTCSARPRDTRPLQISLRGPLRAELTGAMSAASSIAGTLEATITHSYQR